MQTLGSDAYCFRHRLFSVTALHRMKAKLKCSHQRCKGSPAGSEWHGMMQTLGSDWRSAKAGNKRGSTASPLHGIQWHRIILDVSPAFPDSMIPCLTMA